MRSLTTILALALLLALTLLSRNELHVEAQACTINCAGFFTKALMCQNKDHFNIPVDIPTIGADPIVDNCLCVQSVVDPLHACAACRARNGISPTDVTWTFINACNNLYPQRQLFLSPGNAGSRITNPFSSRDQQRQSLASWVMSSASLFLLALTVGLAVLTNLLTA